MRSRTLSIAILSSSALLAACAPVPVAPAVSPAPRIAPVVGDDGREFPELRPAFEHLDRGRFGRAADACEEIIERIGKKPAEADRPLLDAARLLLGDTYVLRDDMTYARIEYDRVVNEAAPGSPVYHRALERLYDVAWHWVVGGRTRRVGIPGTERHFPLIRVSAVGEGLQLLQDVRFRSPNPELTVKAHLLEAERYFARGDFDFAEDQYTVVRRTVGSEYAATAELQAAMCLIGRFRGAEYDVGSPREGTLFRAQSALTDFKKARPAEAAERNVDLMIERIDWAYARRDYETGEFYLRLGDLRPAIRYYKDVVRDARQAKRPNPWAEQAKARLRELGAKE